MRKAAAYAQSPYPSLAIAFLCNCSFLSFHFRPFHNRICPLSLHPIPSPFSSHVAFLPLSPLSSSRSKVSDIRPQHSQSYAAAAATTVPRLSLLLLLPHASGIFKSATAATVDNVIENMCDQGELSHVRFSLAASEVSLLLPYPTLSPAIFSGSR